MRSLVLALALFTLTTACGSPQRTEGGAASGPAVGSAAPEIMLQDQTGRVRTLSEHRGHPVVVYFYPRDATPGCTAEACAFRDAWTRLQAAGAVVYGISTDDVVSHQRFHDEHGLPFDLLADVDGTAAAAYGVPVTAGFASRMTYLVDANGNVAQVEPCLPRPLRPARRGTGTGVAGWAADARLVGTVRPR
jgi:thioredoxin-dependent peroxiredoxin